MLKREKGYPMKKVLRLVILVCALLCAAGAQASAWGSEYVVEGDDQLYGIEDLPLIGRSYHEATVNPVIGKVDHPFNYSSSSVLGRVVRASAFLGGYLRAAFEDPLIKEQLLDGRDFCTKILNFYVLWFEAQLALYQHLNNDHEKSYRLLEEVDHLRKKVLLLGEYFEDLIQGDYTHAAITIRMVLDTIAMQTGQILAL